MTAAPAPAHSRQLALIGGVLALFLVALVLVVRHGDFSFSSSSSTTRGSGVPATETRELASFSGIELSGSNNVNVTVGGAQKVVVSADDNLLHHITTVVRNGRLVIDDTGSFSTSAPMRVDVTVPSVDTLRLTGSGVITAAPVAATKLALVLSGSGVLRVRGTVDQLDVSLGGSGDAELGGLVARAAHTVVSGSGRILVNATSSLDAHVSGSGSIVYTGHPPQVTNDVTGSGAISPG